MSKCGTNAGYAKHVRDKTDKCILCKDAHSRYVKKYYKENSTLLKENRKLKYLKNSDKEKQARREYYKKNSEREKIRERNYKKENPHLKRESERRRRAAKFNNGYEYYTEKQALEIYGTNCYLCGVQIDLASSRLSGIGDWEYGLHIDHVIPLSKGGSDTLENIRPAHAICNLKKHTKSLSK